MTLRRRLALAGAALVVSGVLVVGLGLGWAARSFDTPAVPDDIEVDVVAAPVNGAADALPLPDVRGLPLSDAQQAVADVGLDAAHVTVVETPSALPSGTVVSQDPVGGTTGATAVTLDIAVSGAVPELVGTDGPTAVQTLLELGVQARVSEVYDPDAAVGTVLAIDPGAGSPLPSQLTLTVAGPAGSVFLTDLTAQSGCSTGTADINGTSYSESLLCGAGSSARTTVYLLDRVTTQLTGVLGVLDTSDLQYAGRVTIRGDGVELYSSDVRYGVAVPFTVSTTGVLQLQIEYLRTGDDDYSVSGQLALGDIRVVGSPADVEGLVQ